MFFSPPKILFERVSERRQARGGGGGKGSSKLPAEQGTPNMGLVILGSRPERKADAKSLNRLTHRCPFVLYFKGKHKSWRGDENCADANNREAKSEVRTRAQESELQGM